jgi:hypothetical protein
MYRQKLYSTQAQVILTAVILLVLSVVLGYLSANFGSIVFVSLFAFGFLLIILTYELRRRLSHKESTWLVPFIALSIPFQAVLVRTIPVLLASQLSIILVVLFNWLMFSDLDRDAYLRKIKPLILPTIAFAASIILSYFVTRNVQRDDYVYLLSLIGSIAYAYLACIYCKDLKDIKRVVWIIIIIGVIQMPFLYAQSHGWTNWLPAEFKMFTSAPWGGTVSSVAVLRYGGTFGDYELLAEYLDMAVLFCVGIFVFTVSRKERFFAILSMILMIMAGYYTGSRAFVIGLGGGVAIMVFLIIVKLGFSRKLMNFLLIVLALVLAIAYLSTQQIFSGYITRFQDTQIGLNNYDTRNVVWTASFSLMEKMPFTGYGTGMMSTFISSNRRSSDSPHSLYFWMFLTAGYPGLISIIFLVFTPLLWMLLVISNKYKIIYHPWAIIFISVWVFWAANEIIIEFTRYPFYKDIVFFLFGIMASFFNITFKKTVAINHQSASV